ncbi:hypothetical protein ACIQVE_29210, partial [Pseudomonas sp. NPDC098747]|uniref:hypothetical protein n=1 Tax=Pseudomonas sp. NPDC098747 TaxID=3364487 RepID=UPI00383BAF9D
MVLINDGHTGARHQRLKFQNPAQVSIEGACTTSKSRLGYFFNGAFLFFVAENKTMSLPIPVYSTYQISRAADA